MKKFVYILLATIIILILITYYLYGLTPTVIFLIGIIIALVMADAMRTAGIDINIFKKYNQDIKLLDATMLTDSRCLDIVMTGFLGNKFIIPKFLIEDFQKKTNSTDDNIKNESRKALDTISRLRENENLKIEIIETQQSVVDHNQALIDIAKKTSSQIVTLDYNITKLGLINGVKVLNVNELYLSLKQAFLPGDEITVFVMKEGKDKNQGVGYLEDGTMIVIDNGYPYIGKKVNVLVQSILKNSNGKIIFTKVK